MNEHTAKKQEQANIERVDSQLICNHENTIRVVGDETDMIACKDCGHQESESEWTDRQE